MWKTGMILFHRILCVSLLVAGIVVGAVAVFRISLVAGILYCLLTIIGLVIINYSFCGKCTCRHDTCGLIFPGKLTKFWPARRQNTYSGYDYTAIALSLFLITLFPQYWLWSQKVLLVLFWIIFTVAHIQIRLTICRVCGNENCPALPKRASAEGT